MWNLSVLKCGQHKIREYSKHVTKKFHIIRYINYVLQVCKVNLCRHEDVENSELVWLCHIGHINVCVVDRHLLYKMMYMCISCYTTCVCSKDSQIVQ